MSTHPQKRGLSEVDPQDSSQFAPPRKKSRFNENDNKNEIKGLDDDDDNYEDISNGEIKTRLLRSGKPICLNVGGIKYETTLNTLSLDEDSVLYKMFEGKFSLKPNEDGTYFIDRNGKYFYIILDYLRNGILTIPNSDRTYIMKHLLNEAQFYQITGLIIELQIMSINSSLLSTKQVQQIGQMINAEMVCKKKQFEWQLLYKYNVSEPNQATKLDLLYGDILSIVTGRRSILIVTEHKGKIAGVYIKNKLIASWINSLERIHMFKDEDMNGSGFCFQLNGDLTKTGIVRISISRQYFIVISDEMKHICIQKDAIYIQPSAVEVFQV